jgi:serine-type D-Ala-D-Ala carboxypeptidase/endopeptidase (penicillin-binding protein 4)
VIRSEAEGQRSGRARHRACAVLALCLLTFDCAKTPLTIGVPAPVRGAAGTAPYQQLDAGIRDAMNGPGVSRAIWGIAVQSLSRNQRLFEQNPRTFLVPASVAKLVSLAAAVDAVGWNYSFETTLRATGPVVDGVLQGDLLIVGSGDPAIGGRGGGDVTSWIEGLKAEGIRKVDGRIIGDDNAVEEPRPGATWAWDDLGYKDGALFGALNFSENRLTVIVSAGPAPGTAASLSVEPHAAYRPLANRAITGAAGSLQLLWPEQRPGEAFLTIAGSIPAGAPSTRMSVSAGNPTFWFASVFRNRLQREGIDVSGEAVDIDDLAMPPDRAAARVVYTYTSHPLSEIAQPLLKESINIYGEAVLRLTTGPTGGRTNDEALEALSKRLPSWGLQPDAVQLVDGSGLSRRDALAADTIVTILQRMYDADGVSPWMRALPIAGRDGTLANRFKGTAAEDNLRAKTGTMSNIRALAGYVRTREGEPLAFAIIVNNFEGSGRQALAAIDAIALRLAEFTRGTPQGPR